MIANNRMNFRTRIRVALAPVITAGAWTAMTMISSAYSGSLDHVFGDVKQGLMGTGGITAANADAVVDGIYNNLKCNGIRVPIDMEAANPAAISPAYAKVLARAKTHNMAIYANPMATGDHNLSDNQYAAKIIAYANQFKPRYLGCFNESQLTPDRYLTISAKVKAGLRYKPEYLGPDTQHLRDTEKKLFKAGMANAFTIITSHNAAKDIDATASNWKALKSMSGKPTWATENPRAWSDTEGGQEIGVKSVVDAGLSGLVIYSAFPKSVDASGNLTAKGKDIANGIGARE